MGPLESASLMIKFLFAAGVLAALGWFVVRPMVRVWRTQPDPDELMPKLAELPDEELQIPVDPNDRRKATREEMLAALRADPRMTAMLVQHSIKEKTKDRPRKGAARE
jgi:hypothetical protein